MTVCSRIGTQTQTRRLKWQCINYSLFCQTQCILLLTAVKKMFTFYLISMAKPFSFCSLLWRAYCSLTSRPNLFFHVIDGFPILREVTKTRFTLLHLPEKIVVHCESGSHQQGTITCVQGCFIHSYWDRCVLRIIFPPLQ